MTPHPLATSTITPPSATLSSGEQSVFTAEGKDASGNTVSIPDPRWSTSGGGMITPNYSSCTYTANQAGDYTITCTQSGTTIRGSESISISSPTAVDEKDMLFTPDGFLLFQNYPNPFNPTTKIRYAIPNSVIVKINIYDILGKEVKTLLDEYKAIGTYELEFNGSDLSSGIYFYKITLGNYSEIKKMILMR